MQSSYYNVVFCGLASKLRRFESKIPFISDISICPDQRLSERIYIYILSGDYQYIDIQLELPYNCTLHKHKGYDISERKVSSMIL